MQNNQYNTLEDIALRKDELKAQLSDNSEKIGTLWRDLFVPQKANSKGELIANLIGNAITGLAIWPPQEKEVTDRVTSLTIY